MSVHLRCSSHSQLCQKTTTYPVLHAQQLLDHSHMPPVFVMRSFGQWHQLPSWLAVQVVAQHTNIHCQVHVMSTATNTVSMSLSKLITFQKPHHPHYCIFQCPLETLSWVLFKVYVGPRQNLCFGDNNFYLTSFSTTFGSFARPTTVWVPFRDVISLLCSPQYMIFAQHSNVQCQLHVIDTSNGYNQWRSQKENKEEANYGEVWAQPPAGSRGRAPWSAGQGSRGAMPP